jgi:DNA-binding IclR family transcriptional regulator
MNVCRIAPIFDASGRCRAALTVAGPEYRLPSSGLPELAQLCIGTARAISARMQVRGLISRGPPSPSEVVAS